MIEKFDSLWAMENKIWQVSESESGARLDKWLAAAERLGSRSKALAAIERGKVFINDAEQTTADAARRVQTGEKIRLWMDRPGSAERRYTERHDSGLHLIYEDSSLLVINKPAGLLTVPLPAQPNEISLLDHLKIHLRSDKKREPLVVHRIDRDTSGLVIFAKTPEAQRKLKEQFEQRKAERIYLAVVHGHPKPESGMWRNYLVWNQDALKQQPAERRAADAHPVHYGGVRCVLGLPRHCQFRHDLAPDSLRVGYAHRRLRRHAAGRAGGRAGSGDGDDAARR